MKHLRDIIDFDENTSRKSFKKGSILQREGDVTVKAFYVEKGLLRSYTIDEKGKEHIFMFGSEGWIIADIESQEFERPAELFIECLEDSEVIMFDRRCFKIANLTTDQLRENATLLARRNAVLQKRVLMLMSASAQDRYRYFLKVYPNLPQRISQKMIASYLGITPEALSKIRGKMNEK